MEFEILSRDAENAPSFEVLSREPDTSSPRGFEVLDRKPEAAPITFDPALRGEGPDTDVKMRGEITPPMGDKELARQQFDKLHPSDPLDEAIAAQGPRSHLSKVIEQAVPGSNFMEAWLAGQKEGRQLAGNGIAGKAVGEGLAVLQGIGTAFNPITTGVQEAERQTQALSEFAGGNNPHEALQTAEGATPQAPALSVATDLPPEKTFAAQVLKRFGFNDDDVTPQFFGDIEKAIRTDPLNAMLLLEAPIEQGRALIGKYSKVVPTTSGADLNVGNHTPLPPKIPVDEAGKPLAQEPTAPPESTTSSGVPTEPVGSAGPGAGASTEFQKKQIVEGFDVHQSLGDNPTREAWQAEMLRRNPEYVDDPSSLDNLWEQTQQAVQNTTKSKPISVVAEEIVNPPARTEEPISPTATKNAAIDEQRTQQGLPPLMDAARKEWGTTWDEATRKIDQDPQVQTRLIDDLQNKPRATTDVENALLLHRQIELSQALADADRAIVQAKDAGDEGLVREHEIRRAQVTDDLLNLHNVMRSSGTETGRGLVARKMMVAEDYSLARMETKARAARGGRQLTPEERAEVKTQHEEIQRTQKAVEEHEAAREETARKTNEEFTHKKMVGKARKQNLKEALTRQKTDLPTERQGLIDKVKEFYKGPESLENLGNYIQRLAENFVRSGVTERGKLVDAVRNALKDVIPDLTSRDTADAISGYGKFKKLSSDQAKVQLRDIKGQLQQISKLEDMELDKTAPAKTGMERRSPSDTERQLIKDVNEAKKANNIQTTDPATQLKSSLDSIKKRMMNQLKDLSLQIMNNAKMVKERGAAPSDAMTKFLGGLVKDLRADYNEIFGKPGLSDAEKVARAEKSLERSVERYTERIENNELFQQPKDRTPNSFKQVILRKRLEGLKSHLKKLQAEAGRAGPTDAQRIAATTRALEKSIAEYERRLNEHDFYPEKKGGKTPSTPEIEALKARREALKSEIDEIKKIIDPSRTPEERATAALKTRLKNRTAELYEKIAKGDFKPTPRKVTTLDAEALRLKALNEQAKQLYQDALYNAKQKARSLPEKALDTFVKWRRGFVLSGVGTLGKLTSAAFHTLALTPVKEAIGAGISRALPSVAAKAGVEGAGSMRAEAVAVTQGFTKGMKDAWDILRTGKSELDLVYGKHEVLPRSLIDFIGSLHGALKATPKRAQFARAFEKLAQQAIKQGLDVTDPLVQTRLGVEAYKDANRAIFLQDNRVVTAYKAALATLERPDKVTGKVPLWSKALATGGRTVLPVVRVPTNFVATVFEHLAGSFTGSARVFRAYARGIETLRPEEAQIIMRQLKNGSMGMALLVYGYLKSEDFGGYYIHGDKKKKGDLQVGEVRIGDMTIPKWATHIPAYEIAQIGATVRKVAESRGQGHGEGAMQALLGLLEEVPFVKEQLKLSKLYENPHAFGMEQAKSYVVPLGVSQAAEAFDTDEMGNRIKRKPRDYGEALKSGVPGLRQDVPIDWKKTNAARREQ